MLFAGSPRNGDLTNDPGSSFLSVVCVAFRFWESFPVRKFPLAMPSRLIFKTATINSADDSVMDCSICLEKSIFGYATLLRI